MLQWHSSSSLLSWAPYSLSHSDCDSHSHFAAVAASLFRPRQLFRCYVPPPLLPNPSPTLSLSAPFATPSATADVAATVNALFHAHVQWTLAKREA